MHYAGIVLMSFNAGLIGAIFTVLTVLFGGVCIMLIVSTKTLRDSRDDMEHRIDQLEDERTRDKETIASQSTEIDIWRKAVTGEAQLDSISKLLNVHHAEAVKQWAEFGIMLGHLGRTLDSVDGHLVALIEIEGES